MKTLAVLTAFAALACAAPKVEIGVINGAAFRIDIPENWNGGLVVYCHGYNQAPMTFKEGAPNLIAPVFTHEGYAVAQSGYATGGWAVQEAAVDTESLRRYFISKYGVPKETYLTGHSMGGFLTMMLMEEYPQVYDAAMPMCGPLASSESFQSRGAFDAIVLFNYYFPGILPDPTKIPKDFVSGTADKALNAKITQALDSAPDKAAALRHQNNLKANKDLAGTLTFLVYLIKELNERSGGNPFDNRNVIYSGTLDDNTLNSAIPRYAADPRRSGLSARELHAHRPHRQAHAGHPYHLRSAGSRDHSQHLFHAGRTRRNPEPVCAAVRETRRPLRHPPRRDV